MKLLKPFTIFFFIAFIFTCNNKQANNIESKAEIKEIQEKGVQPFAEAVFFDFTNVRDFTISLDESEAYFTLKSPLNDLSIIMRMHKNNGVWNSPKIASFSGKYGDLEAYLSPDNLKLYFASNRPVSKDSSRVKDFDIWYVERSTINAEWSEPINIGPPINTEADEFYPAIADSKNLYFTAITEETGPGDDIFVSTWNGTTYNKPVALGEGINTKGAEFNAFVAPDESYIIFSGWRRKDGVGSGDLYLSKKEKDVWLPAKNLGETINSTQIDYCPFVNNKTLYFTSRRSNIIQKENGFKDTQELILELNKYDNGSSRIYSVDFQDYMK